MPNVTTEQVHETAQTTKTKEDIFFAILSGLSGLHAGMSSITLARSYMKVCETSGLNLNPYFIKNGHNGPSPKTARMLANRKLKGLGVGAAGVVVAGLSPALSPIPAPFAAARHLSATASTSIHLHRLSKLLAAYKPFGVGDEQVASAIQWLQLAIEVKLKKLAFRGSEAALATTSTLLSFTGVGLVGKIPLIMVNLQLELSRLHVSNKYETLCKIAAMELQWAAFLEQNDGAGDMPQMNFNASSRAALVEQLEQRKSRLGAAITTQVRKNALNVKTGSTGLGPAALIIKEIMEKYTLQGQFFAGHDYLSVINEPAGWNAIAAKLMNI